MLLNPFELVVVLLFHSFAIFRRHWIHWTFFESLSLHLVMKFSFWWYLASDELASDDVITSGALCLQEHFWLQEQFSSDTFKLPFWLFLCCLCSSRTYKWSQNFCLRSCTLELILAYPINNFLIPGYQSKLLRVMLNTFCSNSLEISKYFNIRLLHGLKNMESDE